MSEQEFSEFSEFVEGDEYQTEQESSTIQQMRSELKARDEKLKNLEPEAEAGRQARRKLAFLEAGVDLNTPHGKLFAEAYKGELDVEAVKAKAVEYEVVQAPSSALVTANEREVLEHLHDATAGAAEAGQTPPPDPAQPYKDGRKVYEESGDYQKAGAAHFRAKLDQAADRGDPGVVAR